MPLDTQTYLLRVLESGEYIKVGSSKVLKTDVRIVAATNVDLLKKVQKGKFRQDLYYRLNTVPIRVPALHERRSDINLLFRKFAGDFSDKYSKDAISLDETGKKIMENYRWPGNIRELKNLVEQLSVLTEDHLISATDLVDFAPHLTKRNLPTIAGTDSKTDFEEREILYKFLFDMKGDLNDLKNMFYELVQKNNLEMPTKQFKTLDNPPRADYQVVNSQIELEPSAPAPYNSYEDNAVIINRPSEYSNAEEVDESLSLDEKTKELIQKALKKHKGKRKDAAEELGISERTLYRKIKEYEIAI